MSEAPSFQMFLSKGMRVNDDPYLCSRRGSDQDSSSSSPASFNLYPGLVHNAFNHTVSGEEKASCLRWESGSPVMFHLSDPTGIIPWNATPGKACGATLGDICNTSEVRGRRPDLPPPTSIFPSLIFPLSSPVLPVLPPLHRRAGRRRCHRHRAGKPLITSLSEKDARCYHGVLIRCRSNATSHVIQCAILPVEIQSCSPPLPVCVCRTGSVFHSAVEADLASLKKKKRKRKQWAPLHELLRITWRHCGQWWFVANVFRNRYKLVILNVSGWFAKLLWLSCHHLTRYLPSAYHSIPTVCFPLKQQRALVLFEVHD